MSCNTDQNIEPRADLYFSRGNAYRQLTKYEEAIKDYDKTIELDPHHTQAENMRATCYRDIKIHKSDTELSQLTEVIISNILVILRSYFIQSIDKQMNDVIKAEKSYRK